MMPFPFMQLFLPVLRPSRLSLPATRIHGSSGDSAHAPGVFKFSLCILAAFALLLAFFFAV